MGSVLLCVLLLLLADIFEGVTLVLEETELFRQHKAVLISARLHIDLAVGLSKRDKLVAHFLYRPHEHLEETLLLLRLVLLVQLVQHCHLIADAVVYLGHGRNRWVLAGRVEGEGSFAFHRG